MGDKLVYNLTQAVTTPDAQTETIQIQGQQNTGWSASWTTTNVNGDPLGSNAVTFNNNIAVNLRTKQVCVHSSLFAESPFYKGWPGERYTKKLKSTAVFPLLPGRVFSCKLCQKEI
ncbi:MAG: hypothetical protein LBQ90_05500, partial [Synergistaceae bacterium]|nr:hypothetical protein [Synergistaceae bacterium]